MSGRPEWMVPGARVVEFTSSSSGGTARMVFTTIDRVLKRDVVLKNGERYNADRPVKRRGAWDPSTDLLSADDPRVRRAVVANDISRRKSRIRSLVEDAERAVRTDDPVLCRAALVEALQAVDAWNGAVS